MTRSVVLGAFRCLLLKATAPHLYDRILRLQVRPHFLTPLMTMCLSPSCSPLCPLALCPPSLPV